MTAVLVAVLIGVPVAVFTLWPLVRRSGAVLLPVPPDAREQLGEQKRQALRALRELQFEHEAGHVSDEDYDELRARYEAEAAQVITELDHLAAQIGPEPEPAPPAAVAAPAGRGWRHPLAMTGAAAALVAFGVALGVGIVRYSEPGATAGASMSGPAMPGSTARRPFAMRGAPGAPPGMLTSTPSAGGGGRTLSPEILSGMLQAARASLEQGRYAEAIAAYQAVLKRQPQNVDAMTHLGLIVALGGHADAALQTFERALQLDPNYPPALLYRGQVLYEAKHDPAGAIQSWEKYLEVVPSGQDHERVRQLITQARESRPPR